jgi:DNA topoisomerase-1
MSSLHFVEPTQPSRIAVSRTITTEPCSPSPCPTRDAKSGYEGEHYLSIAPSVENVTEMGLVYVHDDIPGITRKPTANGFEYFSPAGDKIEEAGTLERISKLAIPPAYTKVWICPLEEGHLQATGRDARGRKQYRYHPKWIELSAGNKFAHMLEFGAALPHIRERVDQDLCKKGLPRDKVLATIVWFLENSLIRVGNEEYAKENKSYGLTTMRMRHCKVDGSVIQFRFVGKRGIKHNIEVSDRRMARLVKKIQELPGQELFQYVDSDGTRHSVTSADVNSYLKEITGKDFTAKDFRTWSATVLALAELSHMCGTSSKAQAKRAVTQAMKAVSQQLGNTPAICRKSYVHPGVVNSFVEGSLEKLLQERIKARETGEIAVEDCAEDVILEVLHDIDKRADLIRAA